MRKVLIMAVLVGCVVVMASVVLAQGFRAPVYGTFYGGSGAYTNNLGERVGISAIFLQADMGTAQTGVIYVVAGGATNVLVTSQPGGFTNTLTWADQSAAVPLEIAGVIRYDCTYTNTMKWSLFTVNE